MSKHPEILYLASVPVFFILLYMFTVTTFSYNRKYVKYYSLLCGSLCIVLSILATNFLVTPNMKFSYNTLWALIIDGIFFLISFVGIEYAYKSALSNNKEEWKKINNPERIDGTVMEYKRPKTAFAVGFISRYSLLAAGFFLVATVLTSSILNRILHQYPVWQLLECAAFFGVIFFISLSFLRILVKCDNCHLDIYQLDRELTAYYVTAKEVVKNKKMKCVHCGVEYNLKAK